MEVRQRRLFKITLGSGWKTINAIFADKDIIERYRWFLFEFGKKSSKLFLRNIKDRIKTIPGSKDYKKRLILAEVRDKSAKSWWAIAVSAKPISESKYDPRTSIFHVVTRFPGASDDPVGEILESLGPWTVDTIPFVPSLRAGTVIQKTVSEKDYDRIKDMNFNNGTLTTKRMLKYGIVFDPRHVVYQRLRVIKDYEIEALGHEFGTIKDAKPHWRPSLRWIKRQGISKLEKDKELVRVFTDPKFGKWRQRRHLGVNLTQAELKLISRFQDKVRI